MIREVSPVPSCSMPSASTLPELTSRIVMRAPPTPLPIILASRAIARTMTLVSFPAGRATTCVANTNANNALVLSMRLNFMSPSRLGQTDICFRIAVGETIPYYSAASRLRFACSLNGWLTPGGFVDDPNRSAYDTFEFGYDGLNCQRR